MYCRQLGVLALQLVMTLPVCANLGFEVVWTQPGEGGYSAANALQDTRTGKTLGIVACEGFKGVVRFDLNGGKVWEYPMEPPVSAAPAVADLDGDGVEDIVAADSKGNLVALDQEGKPLWTAKTPSGVIADSCPAISDLDGDGRPEIIVGDTDGTLLCFDHAGSLLWEFSGDGTQMGPALIADIYDSPGKEIVAPSHDRHIYCLGSQGGWLWDLYFPKDLFPISTPILADVDGDDVPEIYVGGGLNHFIRIDPANPRVVLEENVYLHINNCISAADLDGDGKDEVVFGTKIGALRCYAAEGIRWLKDFPDSYFYASPLFLNLDDDPELEIIQYSSGGDVRFLENDGTVLLSFQTACRPIVSPLAGDLDGDGSLEMVCTQAPGSSGVGNIIWAEIGVPYEEDPRNRTVFAGDRTLTCLPRGAKTFPLLPAPEWSSSTREAGVRPAGPLSILSGRNTCRFDVTNPDRNRLALVFELREPDGVEKRFVRHVYGAEGRVAVSFDAAKSGEYSVLTRLVDADGLADLKSSEVKLDYRGFESDRRYLEEEVFDSIENSIKRWEPTNPASADPVRAELVALHGMLAELASASNDERASLLPTLRRSAERLKNVALSGSVLAATRSFVAWETSPWAYFDSRESLPGPTDRTEKLSVSLCVHEFESLALNLTNMTGQTLEVRALCDTIDGEEGLPVAEHIEFRRAVNVPTLRREMIADGLPKLDQGSLLTVASHESQQLWITVNAKEVKPGNYVAHLRLKSVEPDPTEIAVPIEIAVHDLELPRPRPLRFCLWSVDGGPLGTDRDYVLEDLVEHGCTVLFGKPPAAKCNAAGELVGGIDFTDHDASVRRYAPYAFMLFLGGHTGLGGEPVLAEGWTKAFVPYMRAWSEHIKELGIPYDRWAMYPYDEPSTPSSEATVNLA